MYLLDLVVNPTNALEIRPQRYCFWLRNDFSRSYLIVLPRYTNTYVLVPVGNQHSHFTSTIEVPLKIHCQKKLSVDVILGLLKFHAVPFIFMPFCFVWFFMARVKISFES